MRYTTLILFMCIKNVWTQNSTHSSRTNTNTKIHFGHIRIFSPSMRGERGGPKNKVTREGPCVDH